MLMMVVCVARLVSGKWDSHPKTTDLTVHIPSNHSQRMVLLQSYINLQTRSIIADSHRDPVFDSMEFIGVSTIDR